VRPASSTNPAPHAAAGKPAAPMTKTCLLLAVFAFFACERALGQSPPSVPGNPEIVAPVQMIVDFGQAKRKVRVSREGAFDPVAIPAGQQVTITLRFLPMFAGTAARLTILDGGEVTLPSTPLIGVDGTYAFQFRAGNLPGSYRFVVDAVHQYQFTLYGFNPNNPPGRGGGR